MRKVAVVVGAALFVLGAGPAPTMVGVQPSGITAAEITRSTYALQDPYEQCMLTFGCTKYPDGTWSCPHDGIHELCLGA